MDSLALFTTWYQVCWWKCWNVKHFLVRSLLLISNWSDKCSEAFFILFSQWNLRHFEIASFIDQICVSKIRGVWVNHWAWCWLYFWLRSRFSFVDTSINFSLPLLPSFNSLSNFFSIFRCNFIISRNLISQNFNFWFDFILDLIRYFPFQNYWIIRILRRL